MVQQNWALQLSYDGSRYHGFQKLPQVLTIQGELEKALARILKHPCASVAAGRTDAGVHAYGQVVSFVADLAMGPARFLQLLQYQLPLDIVPLALWPVPDTFHARFSAYGRHYRYLIQLEGNPDPFKARQQWYLSRPIDLTCLTQVWENCVGQADWQAFARKGHSHKTTAISVWHASVHQSESIIRLDIIAERFLYGMVRALVGTAVAMASGQLPPSRLDDVLAQQQGRSDLGAFAPACGLYFCRPFYSQNLPLDYPHPLSAAEIPTAQHQDKWWTESVQYRSHA